MARITVEDCLNQIPNLFDLVLTASKRSRRLANGAESMVEWENDKPTVVALREIAAGHVTVSILEENEQQKALEAVFEEDVPPEPQQPTYVQPAPPSYVQPESPSYIKSEPSAYARPEKPEVAPEVEARPEAESFFDPAPTVVTPEAEVTAESEPVQPAAEPTAESAAPESAAPESAAPELDSDDSQTSPPYATPQE